MSSARFPLTPGEAVEESPGGQYDTHGCRFSCCAGTDHMGTGETTRLLVNGVEWTLEAGWGERLGRELLGAVADLGSHPAATLIKRSLQRSVFRVTLGDGGVALVKVYHIRGWKERVKRVVFGPKPLVEWGASHRLLALGVPASHAVAVGIPTPPSAEVEGYLIVEVLPDVVSIQSYLRSGAGGEGALGELAGFVRRLHDGGVRHHDLHLGNILAHTAPPMAGERFLIIDLHRVGIGRPPGLRHRARAIGQLLHGLPGGVEAFLGAYSAAGPPGSGMRVSVDSVVAAIERHAARRLRSRAKRCLVNSSEFAVETLEGWRIWHRREWSARDVLALWAQHRQAAAPAATRLAEGFELRQYPARGFLARLVARSPGVREYAAAHRARIEWGSGPEAIAGAECRRGPDRGRSFALLAHHQDSTACCPSRDPSSECGL